MEHYIDPAKVAALSPENLLAVFRTLLLIEESINHFSDHLSVEGWELVEPVGDVIGIGYVFEGNVVGSIPGKRANIELRSAA